MYDSNSASGNSGICASQPSMAAYILQECLFMAGEALGELRPIARDGH
jgi:hypothetical protein